MALEWIGATIAFGGEKVRCQGHYVAPLCRNSLGGTASRGSHWALYSEEATMRKELIITVAAGCLIGMTSLPALAASAFEGVWQVKDTAGKPFEITLSSGGAAKATRGEGMTGTWKEESDAVVITWNTGWTTKITKQGNQYHKAAYRKGQSLDAAPANSSDAQKVK